MKKQFIAKLLVLALVLSMVPVSIVAANAAGAAGSDRTCGADDTCGRPGSSGGYTAPDTTAWMSPHPPTVSSRSRSWPALPPWP